MINNERNMADDFANLVAEKVVEMMRSESLIVAQDTRTGEQQTGQSSKCYSISDVCKMLKIPKATFARHKKMGLIKPSFYVGRSPRFTEEDISNYLHPLGDENVNF